MKLKTTLMICILFTPIFSVKAQGTFRNLDFESATVHDLPLNSGELVSIGEGVPGWTAFLGNTQLSSMLHNGLSAGSSALSIFGPVSNPLMIIDGKYTAVLLGGLNGSLSLAQTGVVPLNSRSIVFKTALASGPIDVSLGGTLLDIIPIKVESNYTEYGADISEFAGKTEELRFTAPADTGAGPNAFELDSIQFSSGVVPEPSVCALLAIGFALLGWNYQRRNFNRK